MPMNGGCSQVKAASETYIDPFQVISCPIALLRRV